MKIIIVNEKTLSEFSPYQGTTYKLKIGDKLRILSLKIPCVSINETFSIVTNDLFSDNTLRTIEQSSNKDAEKWGWNIMNKEFYDSLTKNGATYHLNRWSIKTKFLKLK
jgi:hypothetical protein